jgi:hypothetical protein
VTLLLLLAQFVTGMAVNVYVKIAPVHPGTSASYVPGAIQGVAWAIGRGAPALAIHSALGILLAIGSLGLVALSIALRQRAWIVASILGLLGILGGGLNGIGFLNYGTDFSTFLMAVGFSLAVASYMVPMFVTSQPAREFGEEQRA